MSFNAQPLNSKTELPNVEIGSSIPPQPPALPPRLLKQQTLVLKTSPLDVSFNTFITTSSDMPLLQIQGSVVKIWPQNISTISPKFVDEVQNILTESLERAGAQRSNAFGTRTVQPLEVSYPLPKHAANASTCEEIYKFKIEKNSAVNVKISEGTSSKVKINATLISSLGKLVKKAVHFIEKPWISGPLEFYLQYDPKHPEKAIEIACDVIGVTGVFWARNELLLAAAGPYVAGTISLGCLASALLPDFQRKVDSFPTVEQLEAQDASINSAFVQHMRMRSHGARAAPYQLVAWTQAFFNLFCPVHSYHAIKDLVLPHHEAGENHESNAPSATASERTLTPHQMPPSFIANATYRRLLHDGFPSSRVTSIEVIEDAPTIAGANSAPFDSSMQAPVQLVSYGHTDFQSSDGSTDATKEASQAEVSLRRFVTHCNRRKQKKEQEKLLRPTFGDRCRVNAVRTLARNNNTLQTDLLLGSTAVASFFYGATQVGVGVTVALDAGFMTALASSLVYAAPAAFVLIGVHVALQEHQKKIQKHLKKDASNFQSDILQIHTQTDRINALYHEYSHQKCTIHQFLQGAQDVLHKISGLEVSIQRKEKYAIVHRQDSGEYTRHHISLQNMESSVNRIMRDVAERENIQNRLAAELKRNSLEELITKLSELCINPLISFRQAVEIDAIQAEIEGREGIGLKDPSLVQTMRSIPQATYISPPIIEKPAGIDRRHLTCTRRKGRRRADRIRAWYDTVQAKLTVFSGLLDQPTNLAQLEMAGQEVLSCLGQVSELKGHLSESYDANNKRVHTIVEFYASWVSSIKGNVEAALTKAREAVDEHKTTTVFSKKDVDLLLFKWNVSDFSGLLDALEDESTTNLKGKFQQLEKKSSELKSFIDASDAGDELKELYSLVDEYISQKQAKEAEQSELDNAIEELELVLVEENVDDRDRLKTALMTMCVGETDEVRQQAWEEVKDASQKLKEHGLSLEDVLKASGADAAEQSEADQLLTMWQCSEFIRLSVALENETPESQESLFDELEIMARALKSSIPAEDGIEDSKTADLLLAADKIIAIKKNYLSYQKYKDAVDNSKKIHKEISQLENALNDMQTAKTSEAKGKAWKVVKKISKTLKELNITLEDLQLIFSEEVGQQVQDDLNRTLTDIDLSINLERYQNKLPHYSICFSFISHVLDSYNRFPEHQNIKNAALALQVMNTLIPNAIPISMMLGEAWMKGDVLPVSTLLKESIKEGFNHIRHPTSYLAEDASINPYMRIPQSLMAAASLGKVVVDRVYGGSLLAKTTPFMRTLETGSEILHFAETGWGAFKSPKPSSIAPLVLELPALAFKIFRFAASPREQINEESSRISKLWLRASSYLPDMRGKLPESSSFYGACSLSRAAITTYVATKTQHKKIAAGLAIFEAGIFAYNWYSKKFTDSALESTMTNIVAGRQKQSDMSRSVENLKSTLEDKVQASSGDSYIEREARLFLFNEQMQYLWDAGNIDELIEQTHVSLPQDNKAPPFFTVLRRDVQECVNFYFLRCHAMQAKINRGDISANEIDDFMKEIRSLIEALAPIPARSKDLAALIQIELSLKMYFNR